MTVLERQERVVGRWGGLRPSAIGSAGLGSVSEREMRFGSVRTHVARKVDLEPVREPC